MTGEDVLDGRALMLAQMLVGVVDVAARPGPGERRSRLLARPHRLDRVVLQRDHLARGKGPAWRAPWLSHPDELARRDALLKLGPDRADGHLAHRPPERIS